MKKWLLFLVFITMPVGAQWNTQHEEGWHWYQDPKEEQSQKNVFADPLQEIAHFRESIELLRAEAILRPTENTVRAYIERQVLATQKADRFSEVWDAVMRRYPQLDYALLHPTAQFARHIYLDEQKIAVKKAIERFKDTYGFLFFFKSGCRYCEAMIPVIKTVSSEHGIALTAISIDGSFLTELHSLPDNGIAKKMGVVSVPAIFAVNPSQEEWFPIATGPISALDLEERIWTIANYMNSEESINAKPNS